MKSTKLSLIILIAMTILMTSCQKDKYIAATVVRDCTGTYLRSEGKDLQVCNLEKVAAFADGITVTATFKKLNECNGSAKEAFVCNALHASEGWIEVRTIK